MKTKRITKKEVEQYLLSKHRITESHLLATTLSPGVRDEIINECFKKFTGYKMTNRWGLIRGYDRADTFPNYTSFKHIHSIDGLVWDMNKTVRTREKLHNQVKLKMRQLQQKQKARREFIRKVKAQKREHLNMWKRGSPKKKTQEKNRMNELEALKRAKSWNQERNR